MVPGCSCSLGGCPGPSKASVLVSRSVNELYVDDPDKDSGGKIDVSLNISLPNLHCEREYPRRDPSFTRREDWDQRGKQGGLPATSSVRFSLPLRGRM